METLVLVTPPAVEPLALTDAKLHLRVDHSADDSLIADLIATARQIVEDHIRSVLITQRWRLKRDGFPGFDPLYQRIGYPQIMLPKPPLQAIASFQYVDVAGQLQTLTEQIDYGVAVGPLYGYQLERGGDGRPARVLPPFARPWPPCRLVPANVLLDFDCGYCSGTYVTISGQALAAIAGVVFQAADDGKLIYIPGAGPQGTRLVATLTVDGQGNGTIAPAAAAPVIGALAFYGGEIPGRILAALKLQLDWLYTHRGEEIADPGTPAGLAPGVEALLSPYRNMVS